MLARICTRIPRVIIPTRSFSCTVPALKTLYVGNLPWTIKDDELRTAFEEFGEVSSSRVVTDRLSGRSRGFGFVDLTEDSAADVAVEEMNGKELDGRALTVNISVPREPGSYDNARRERPSYGGDRGGERAYGRSYDRDERRGSGGYGRRDDRGEGGRSYEGRGRARNDYKRDE